MKNELYHYGIKRRSGRYPWGSGERPFQGENRSAIGSQNKIKYESPASRKIKNVFITAGINTPLQTANMIIPGFGLIANPIITFANANNMLKNKFDKTDYFKKEGPPEKISELKIKNQESDSTKDLKSVNPRIGQQKGRINNCLNCTAAMEMRARGYDVVARSSGSGDLAGIWKGIFKDAKIENPRVERIKGETRKEWVTKAFDNFCNQIEKNGEGSRGSAMFMYEKMNGSGHSIFWKVENGTVVFYDGQCKKINNTNLFSLSDPNSYMFVRLDNLKLNGDNISTMVVSSDRKRGEWKQ